MHREDSIARSPWKFAKNNRCQIKFDSFVKGIVPERPRGFWRAHATCVRKPFPKTLECLGVNVDCLDFRCFPGKLAPAGT